MVLWLQLTGPILCAVSQADHEGVRHIVSRGHMGHPTISLHGLFLVNFRFCFNSIYTMTNFSLTVVFAWYVTPSLGRLLILPIYFRRHDAGTWKTTESGTDQQAQAQSWVHGLLDMLRMRCDLHKRLWESSAWHKRKTTQRNYLHLTHPQKWDIDEGQDISNAILTNERPRFNYCICYQDKLEI